MQVYHKYHFRNPVMKCPDHVVLAAAAAAAAVPLHPSRIPLLLSPNPMPAIFGFRWRPIQNPPKTNLNRIEIKTNTGYIALLWLHSRLNSFIINSPVCWLFRSSTRQIFVRIHSRCFPISETEFSKIYSISSILSLHCQPTTTECPYCRLGWLQFVLIYNEFQCDDMKKIPSERASALLNDLGSLLSSQILLVLWSVACRLWIHHFDNAMRMWRASTCRCRDIQIPLSI